MDIENFNLANENPLRIKYIKALRSYMWILGAWPGETFGEKIPLLVRMNRKLLPVYSMLLVLGQMNYLFQKNGEVNLIIMGDLFLTLLLSSVTFSRSILPNLKQYGDFADKFLMKFHLIHFKHKGFNEIHLMCDKISSYFTKFMMGVMVVGIMSFNATAMYNNLKSGAFSNSNAHNITYQFSVYYIYYGFDPFDHFKLCTVLNYYFSYCCAVSVCSLDLFIFLIVFQIIGHLNILSKVIESISLSETYDISQSHLNTKVKMFDINENNEIHLKLTEIIKHHILIVDFTDNVSSILGPILGITYLFDLAICCLSLFLCSQGDPNALPRYGPLTVIIFAQLVCVSVVFEIIGTVSDKLKDDLYNIPWECMDTTNRRLVCILLHNMQTPLNITAIGVVPIGVQTMAKVLKTSFSYFTLLKSLEE